jgi:hypothetical protein
MIDRGTSSTVSAPTARLRDAGEVAAVSESGGRPRWAVLVARAKVGEPSVTSTEPKTSCWRSLGPRRLCSCRIRGTVAAPRGAWFAPMVRLSSVAVSPP